MLNETARKVETWQALKKQMLRTVIICLLPALALGCSRVPPSAPGTTPSLDKAEVLARVGPAVVTVVATNEDGEQESLGSGVIVKADGVILTAWHVVAGKSQAQVKTASGVSYPVEGLLGWDAGTDFAVLKIAGKALPIAPLGDSDEMEEGDPVLVVGAPQGLEQSISDGIVSAVRSLLEGCEFFKITAPVSEECSGGPLLNVKGEVVGISSSLLVEDERLSFASAINDIKPRLEVAAEVTPLAQASRIEYAGSAEALFLAGVLIFPEDGETQEAKEKFEAALVLFRQVADKRKDYPCVHYSMGGCLSGLGRYQEAIEAYKQAIRIKPDNERAYNNLGLAYYELGRHQEAIEAFEQALRIEPDFAEAHYGLGLAYLYLGRHQEAVEAYKQAIHIKPDYADAHNDLGLAYGKLGRYEESIEASKQAIRIKPDYAVAHYDLGLAYFYLGRYEESIEAYKQAIRINPDYAEAHVNLGVTYAELGRYQEAVETYKKAIRFKPDDSIAHCNLGAAYHNLGGYQEAIEAYTKAIHTKPDYADAHYGLGVVYADLGRYQEAIEAFKRAIRIKPDYAEAHGNLGVAYSMSGKHSRALDEYKILKELDADMAAKLLDFLERQT
ncbi:MAG: tetratricopeptide repeat protein [Armatimonadetes bacterium]|nr:tetratricopeptide repeat protein [Armatimonadota bacterium]NIM23969.1 tetratricopeptide repeat protein [Armatimonadota bacterium]NIM67816.1 tetratricopeptide repeat protein [Armatimonadota bacterium]NIO97436.1 tetratricopeptide repeat protein [Armatimonadota bacterium]NIT31372.1 tetratricopeptide repeat protein [Armatimonadota bacterium]